MSFTCFEFGKDRWNHGRSQCRRRPVGRADLRHQQLASRASSRLAGDIRESSARSYAGHFGIEGVLKEELIDLSATPEEEIALLRTSPAAGSIGTCRYKLKKGQDLDFERVVDVLKAHDVGYFFYIGGNDSQDTAHKVSKLAHDRGLDLIATGVPKTIDNDLGDPGFTLLDHSPGYGSIARYYAHYVRQANEENARLCTG